MIHLGKDGNDFHRIAHMTDVAQQAANQWPRGQFVFDQRNFQVVSIHPVYPSESDIISLVAITSNGKSTL